MTKSMCLEVLVLLCFFGGKVSSQVTRQVSLQSPCPEVFIYEPTTDQEDRWYGVITLRTREELHGVWVHVYLDKPAELLGNWFGEATSSDNMHFIIKNREFNLLPGPPVALRFFIKFDQQKPVPVLTMIRLNGKTVCGNVEPTPLNFNTLHISHPRDPERQNANSAQPESGGQSNFNQDNRPTTGSGNRPPNNGGNRPNTRPPSTDSGTGNTFGSASGINRRPEATNNNNEEDFFPGDFNPSRRPIVTTLLEATTDNACGVVLQQPRPLITHGKETSIGQWPWHAAVYRSKGTDLQYICGGSLISRRHILTAAHCVTKLTTNRPINPELLQVYLGKFSLRKLNPGVQSMIVNRVLVHPNYNATVFHNDIAVLKLVEKASVTEYVRPVCLWDGDTNLNSVQERLGTVIGWGYDETGTLTENLMQAQMPIVSTETCIFSNREFFSRFTSSKTYCAGFRNGTSACTGDSGGGMFFPKSVGDGKTRVWQIRGVVSLSAALQSEKVVCDTSNYIIFTDVAKYLDWIKDTIEKR